jgi:peptide-methionine (R)-S-oxide reductase
MSRSNIIIFIICLFLWQSYAFAKTGDMTMFDFKDQKAEFWKKHLSPEVHNICRESGTERAFSGKYDKFYEKGIYHCNCCGGDHPLFSSEAKYDSKTGWPSFWEPINKSSITMTEEKNIFSIFAPRVEVSCSRCGAHLGHVFDDGPKDKTSKRFCMNSLALHFVPEGEEAKNSILDE